MKSIDIMVIGGGLSGAALALGLVRQKVGKVMLLDQHLPSQRLSRGNFGLTWFMCKGAENPAYAAWCRMATREWPEFAAQLEALTGYDVELEWKGGAVQAFGREEFDVHAASIKKIGTACEEAGLDYPVQMLTREQTQDLIPDMSLGEEVSGAMYTKEQGHVNPLKLLAAMRSAFQKKGGIFHGGTTVRKITPLKNASIAVSTGEGDFSCGRVVVAAGHGCARLLNPLGETPVIYPQRGQLMVTDRYPRCLPFPFLSVRQTNDGTFMIGLSSEDTAMDTNVTPRAMNTQAKNAIRLFPKLAKLNWVRAWGAVRVMTPDGAPIYSRVKGHENLFMIAQHSGLSLAPVMASRVAPWILGNSVSGSQQFISQFSNGRFHV
ncbi:MAG: FAD-binding oxidoreductase [Desulfobacteraceae bacterium]|nr:FAD-binding oxidoreductase [Desulfobacteraceae bacterium]